MAKFNPAGERTNFALPEVTRKQIKALIDAQVCGDARDVVITAVSALWEHHLGPVERDVFAELDEVKRRLGILEA